MDVKVLCSPGVWGSVALLPTIQQAWPDTTLALVREAGWNHIPVLKVQPVSKAWLSSHDWEPVVTFSLLQSGSSRVKQSHGWSPSAPIQEALRKLLRIHLGSLIGWNSLIFTSTTLASWDGTDTCPRTSSWCLLSLVTSWVQTQWGRRMDIWTQPVLEDGQLLLHLRWVWYGGGIRACEEASWSLQWRASSLITCSYRLLTLVAR